MAEKSSRAGVLRDARNSPSAPNGRGNPTRNSVRGGQRLRLGRIRILRGYKAFSGVMSGGKSYSAPPLRLFIRVKPGSGAPATVGFAVQRGRRTAARRNRAKRVMREAFRLQQDLWERVGGVEVVWLYGGDPGEPVRFDVVKNAMLRLMKKVLPSAE